MERLRRLIASRVSSAKRGTAGRWPAPSAHRFTAPGVFPGFHNITESTFLARCNSLPAYPVALGAAHGRVLTVSTAGPGIRPVVPTRIRSLCIWRGLS